MDPRRVELILGERGKPRLADDSTDLRFSVSHSGDLVALAFCSGREVGVDVEARRNDLCSEEIARRYLPARVAKEIERRAGAERMAEFFRAWVRQEAYAKARGVGLELIGESPSAHWLITDLDLADGYSAAVAVEGPTPVQVAAGSL